MDRETIEHPWSIPDDIKAGLDLRSGADRGRVYRLAPPGFRPRPAPKLSRATTSELVTLLDHPNAWHRDTAHRLLFERQDRAATAPLRGLLHGSREPLGRLHALWSLDGLGSLEDEDLLVALADPVGNVREHAVALAEPRLGGSGRLEARVIALADDPAPRVRSLVAFTLGEIADGDPKVVRALASLARRDSGDPWIRTAILSSSGRIAGRLFEAIAEGLHGPANDGLSHLLRDLAGLVGASGDAEATAQLIDRLAAGDIAPAGDELLNEVLIGLGDGFARAGRKTLRDVSKGRPAAVALLSSTLGHAAETAAETAADPRRRERAIALLGQADLATAVRTLGSVLVPGEPKEIQSAAVEALSRFVEPPVASLLIEKWGGLASPARSEVVAGLLSRPAWTAALLDAVQAGAIPAAVIPTHRRAQLLAHRDPAIAARARAVLEDDRPGPRAEAYARYRTALDLPADRGRGARVFERDFVECHKLGERGRAVGPNLASVQRRTPEELLLHILDPNREVAPDYLEYAVALDDGRVLTGLIAAESAGSLTLRRPGGGEETVLRANVEAVTGTGKSLMPEGMERRITPQEMADLIAYILRVQL
jgi:putative heme-binding domain-containing protein